MNCIQCKGACIKRGVRNGIQLFQYENCGRQSVLVEVIPCYIPVCTSIYRTNFVIAPVQYPRERCEGCEAAWR